MNMNNETILAMFGLPGGLEWIVIAVVALLIFGRRLPDVARSLGKSIVEFKKGIRDVRDDVETQSQISEAASAKLEQPSDAGRAASPASAETKEQSPTS